MLKSIFSRKFFLPMFACIALLSISACAVTVATVTVMKNSKNEGIVNYQNFAHVQSSMQMNDYQKLAGGVNKWYSFRTPVSIAKQPTIRMNRDTLYSGAVVNVSKGATISLPDSGDRYMSLMTVNEDGYTNFIHYGQGEYELNPANVGSDYAFVIVRTLVDPHNPQDIEAVNKLQDAYKITAKNNKAYKMPKWEMASYTKTFDMLIDLFALEDSTKGMFGSKETADPIGLLLGAAAAFGALPSEGAHYLNVTPQKGDAFKMVLKDVPVKGFWSISIYNKNGYFFESKYGAPSISNIIATPNKDDSYTLYFGNCENEKTNCLAIEDGWNFIMRLYQPEEAITSGEWKMPALTPIK